MSDGVWNRDEIESPCIRLCVVDPGSRLCMGCFRSTDEIAAWSAMSPEARRTVMQDLASRAERIKPVRRGGREGRRRTEG